ncbi:tetratricopeptide repeat protein [Streptomyces niveus]|uniref:tetratricopeptide repeat protein n=1 Tax=Streptomyces niveus TaxID=193462 RepID=UPI00342CDD4A
MLFRNNLATAYEAAGDLERALPLYERTVADRERQLGGAHPDTLTSRNNLAGALQETGASGLERAVGLYERTLAESELVLGPEHPRTLLVRSRAGSANGSSRPGSRFSPTRNASSARTTRTPSWCAAIWRPGCWTGARRGRPVAGRPAAPPTVNGPSPSGNP